MFASIKKIFKWNPTKNLGSKKYDTSFFLIAFIGILEDILFWRKMWLSLSFIFFINVIFFICVHSEVKFLEFLFGVCATIMSFDAFEAWLKYKHRNNCLKRLVTSDGTVLSSSLIPVKDWANRRWIEFVYLRQTNHTKAFLLVNIILSVLFLIARYINGYILMYLLCMAVCFLQKIGPIVQRILKKIEVTAESDAELEGLIPEISEVDIKLLSIEPDHHERYVDERQSLDYWKPEDLPLEESSDSSDNSSSLVTNISIEKMRNLEKDVETSDSSDDEYIPLEKKEQLQSTLEVVHPSSTWGSTAYNALFNFSGAIANMVYTKSEQSKRKRVSSVDSTDGFEMIDKNDLI